MTTSHRTPTEFPKQETQPTPGKSSEMKPEPAYTAPWYKGSGKLAGKVALITGGDSGIGRSVAILYAREGCDVAIVYLNEASDAEETKKLVSKEGRECLCIQGDLVDSSFCKQAVKKCVDKFGKIDILVNNAGTHETFPDIREITEENLDRTFRSNIYSFFFVTQEALNHMGPGSCIINTNSVVSYKGHPELLDYAATKGAITTFTYSLASNLASKGIRVNAVAPGPIWTPLITSTFSPDKIKSFGQDTALGRAGQPEECAPAYVFLASKDSSYITGQAIHVNGGMIVGS